MIDRAEHMKNYTTAQNELIQDSRLSFEARALMVFMLSLPDDWSFSIKGLASQTGLAERKVMELVKELKKLGYIEQRSRRSSRGVIEGWEWYIHEEPIQSAEKPQCGLSTVWLNQSVDQPQCGKTAPIQNTKYNKVLKVQSTKGNKKVPKKTTTKSFIPPTLEEVRAYCQERGSSVDPVRFFDYYTAGEWKDAKGNPVKNWKQKLITWEKKSTPAASAPRPIVENQFTTLRREEGYE